MRLTNIDREAFVRSAMDDVPSIDYSTQAKNLVLEHLKETVPVDLQNAIAKYPDWFEARTVGMPPHLDNFATKLNHDYQSFRRITTPAVAEKIEEIAKLAEAQDSTRYELSQKLRGAILSVSTLKQALELLPEFTKYLPEDRDGDKKCRQMPVVANLVTDLMAAGWPKGKVAPAPANK